MAHEDRPRKRLGGAMLLASLCVASGALAPVSGAAVPAAQYTITLNQGAPHAVPGLFTQGDALGEIDTLPSPLALARVVGQGTSIVEVQYWFRVNGPQPNVEVPIRIDGRVTIDAGNTVFQQGLIWGVSANMTSQSLDGPLGGPGVGSVDADVAGVGCNPNSVGPNPVPLPIPTCSATAQDELVQLTLLALSGADNRVTLLATANNQAEFAADFEARVDPVISFAPGFDDTGYTIEVSEGVGNAVPEPSAALMTPAGAAVLLLLRRRKRRLA